MKRWDSASSNQYTRWFGCFYEFFLNSFLTLWFFIKKTFPLQIQTIFSHKWMTIIIVFFSCHARKICLSLEFFIVSRNDNNLLRRVIDVVLSIIKSLTLFELGCFTSLNWSNWFTILLIKCYITNNVFWFGILFLSNAIWVSFKFSKAHLLNLKLNFHYL